MWCYLVLNRSLAGSSAPSSPPGTVMSPESPPVSGFYYGLIKAVTERCPRRVMPLRGLSAGVGPLEPYRLAPEAAAKHRRLFVREHRFGRTSWGHVKKRRSRLALVSGWQPLARGALSETVWGYWLFWWKGGEGAMRVTVIKRSHTLTSTHTQVGLHTHRNSRHKIH